MATVGHTLGFASSTPRNEATMAREGSGWSPFRTFSRIFVELCGPLAMMSTGDPYRIMRAAA